MDNIYDKYIHPYRPYFRFHSSERYFPVSVERYINLSEALQDDTVVLKEGSYTYDTLDFMVNSLSHPETTYLNSELISNPSTLQQVPLYWTVVSEDDETITILFMIFFSYNGPLNCCNIKKVGAHQSDLEHITMVLDKGIVHPSLQRIYLGAHEVEGKWYTPKEFEFMAGRPVVYVALDSHALYPIPSTYFRMCGCVNDHTDSSGILWIPRKVEYISKETPWNNYIGFLGGPYPGHVHVPLAKSWWVKESEDSITSCGRLFSWIYTLFGCMPKCCLKRSQ